MYVAKKIANFDVDGCHGILMDWGGDNLHETHKAWHQIGNGDFQMHKVFVKPRKHWG